MFSALKNISEFSLIFSTLSMFGSVFNASSKGEDRIGKPPSEFEQAVNIKINAAANDAKIAFFLFIQSLV